jgi:preprotein translocase subunit SecD
MKRRGVVGLGVMVALLLALSYVFLFGVSIGVRDFRPIGAQIKSKKLGLDLIGGFYAVYQADSANVEDFAGKLQGTINIFRSRLDAKGMTEATIILQGTDSIRVEIPSIKDDPSVLSEYLAKPAKLEWRDSNGSVILTGADIKKATAGTFEGQYMVGFELSGEGTTKFANATAANVGKQIGIYVDDKLISNPRVNSVIASGKGQIEGSFTREAAIELATLIESGAIPLNLNETEVHTISATLGADVIQKSVKAGIIGTILVMLLMFGLYRAFGLMANIALGFYLLLVFFCILTVPGVQLTLSGIAGIVLSVGMAVDANVIIFERIREELRLGKAVQSSMETGFHKAFGAILDSNVTTIIAAVVLIVFGAGSIKGFAYTLAIGVSVSMFSAIMITRFLLRRVVMLGFKNTKWLVRV